MPCAGLFTSSADGLLGLAIRLPRVRAPALAFEVIAIVEILWPAGALGGTGWTVTSGIRNTVELTRVGGKQAMPSGGSNNNASRIDGECVSADASLRCSTN